eukprot:GHVS01082611.1.p1 GENE.GHVS01082611.1~~GHVS01082611.1.p1  ORF type:complete len:432 (-),score=40.95 GHVS01082611.1:205-1500(-)
MADLGIFHWTYQEYNAFTLSLSLFMVLGLVLFQFLIRDDGLLSVAFRCVNGTNNRRLTCYNTDICWSTDGAHVKYHLRWLLRTVIVVVACYLWQTCIVSYKALNINYYNHRLIFREECKMRAADCFGASKPWHFFLFWSVPDELCSTTTDFTDTAISDNIIPQHSFVICIRWISPDSLVYTAHLAIAFALSQMIVSLSEVVVWILLETQWPKVWSVGLVCISIAFLVFWISSIFIGMLFSFFTSWLGFVELLSVPLVLLCCREIARSLRRIRRLRVQKWAAKADKPVAQLAEEEVLLAATSNIQALHQLRSVDLSVDITPEGDNNRSSGGVGGVNLALSRLRNTYARGRNNPHQQLSSCRPVINHTPTTANTMTSRMTSSKSIQPYVALDSQVVVEDDNEQTQLDTKDNLSKEDDASADEVRSGGTSATNC